jgi:hypothetical protein
VTETQRLIAEGEKSAYHMRSVLIDLVAALEKSEAARVTLYNGLQSIANRSFDPWAREIALQVLGGASAPGSTRGEE